MIFCEFCNYHGFDNLEEFMLMLVIPSKAAEGVMTQCHDMRSYVKVDIDIVTTSNPKDNFVVFGGSQEDILVAVAIANAVVVFMTVTLSERHSGLCIRLMRIRRKDPALSTGIAQQFRDWIGHDRPSLYAKEHADTHEVVDI